MEDKTWPASGLLSRKMGRGFLAPEAAPLPTSGRQASFTPDAWCQVGTFSRGGIPRQGAGDGEQVSDAGHARTCSANLLQCPILPYFEVKKDWAVD